MTDRPLSAVEADDTLHVLILGAAAGGGFPQWNCDCPGCRAARSGKALPSGQVSLAISANGTDWVLINASPDILSQIAATPELHPRGLRQSPIRAVVVTNGEVDAVAGLLSLREGTAFDLWASDTVHATLAQNSIFDVLKPHLVARKHMQAETVFRPSTPDGSDMGFAITPFIVPGKPAWYLRDHKVPDDGDTVALEINAAGSRIFIFTACAEVTQDIRERVRGADMVFFDGTLWRDDEMILAGLAQKTGASMGHVSMSGPDGSIARLGDLGIGRKIFVHINNSNPVLLPNCPERAEAEAAGWEIGKQGARYSLCSN